MFAITAVRTGLQSGSQEQEFSYRNCCACFDPIFESPYNRNNSHFPNKRMWGATGNDTLSRMLNMINAPKLPI